MAISETTASAPESAQASCHGLVVRIICLCFAYVQRASDERTEPESKTKAEIVISKRACVNIGMMQLIGETLFIFGIYFLLLGRPLVSLVYAVLVTTCLFRRALITVKPAQVSRSILFFLVKVDFHGRLINKMHTLYAKVKAINQGVKIKHKFCIYTFVAMATVKSRNLALFVSKNYPKLRAPLCKNQIVDLPLRI